MLEMLFFILYSWHKCDNCSHFHWLHNKHLTIARARVDSGQQRFGIYIYIGWQDLTALLIFHLFYIICTIPLGFGI
jgi:hypothetical protein